MNGDWRQPVRRLVVAQVQVGSTPTGHKGEALLDNLEFHKKLISKITSEGVTGDALIPYVESIWHDAQKGININIAPVIECNSATDEELELFADFIVEGVDFEGLIQGYKEEVLGRLYSLTDEELEKEKEFYEYQA